VEKNSWLFKLKASIFLNKIKNETRDYQISLEYGKLKGLTPKQKLVVLRLKGYGA